MSIKGRIVKSGNLNTKSLSRFLGKAGVCVVITAVCLVAHPGVIQGTATRSSTLSDQPMPAERVGTGTDDGKLNGPLKKPSNRLRAAALIQIFRRHNLLFTPLGFRLQAFVPDPAYVLDRRIIINNSLAPKTRGKRWR